MSAVPLPVDPIPRLREVLAGSGETPRPVADRVLPKGWKPLFASRVLKFRPSAVLVPLLLDGGRPRVLLTRRAETLRQHKGQISFPGGRRDEGDISYAAAALREAHEEVGLPPAAVELIGYLEDMPTLSGYRITPVVGLIHEPFEPMPHAGEVAELVEVPLDEILDGERFRSVPIERFGIHFPTQELQYGPHRIWGATAAILWTLRLKYRGEY